MRHPAWVFLLGIVVWANPLGAQETLRYDLSQTPLEYRVEVTQDMEVPLPAETRSQVRTTIGAKMRWTAEREREDAPAAQRRVHRGDDHL